MLWDVLLAELQPWIWLFPRILQSFLLCTGKASLGVVFLPRVWN